MGDPRIPSQPNAFSLLKLQKLDPKTLKLLISQSAICTARKFDIVELGEVTGYEIEMFAPYDNLTEEDIENGLNEYIRFNLDCTTDGTILNIRQYFKLPPIPEQEGQTWLELECVNYPKRYQFKGIRIEFQTSKYPAILEQGIENLTFGLNITSENELFNNTTLNFLDGSKINLPEEDSEYLRVEDHSNDTELIFKLNVYHELTIEFGVKDTDLKIIENNLKRILNGEDTPLTGFSMKKT